MFYKYHIKEKTLQPISETNFTSFKILERRDLEKWVEDQPDIVGEELLIVTTEYDKFDKTNERLDVLALDKDGKIVVLELKRDDSGKSVELQAIKYAAYCSTLTLSDVVKMRKEYLAQKGRSNGIDLDVVKKEVTDFIDNDAFEEIDDQPRIVLLSRDYRPEVTAAVLWLRTFGVDISCIKLTPYQISDDEIGIVSQKLIPLPEAEEYQMKVVNKEMAEKGMTRTQQEYLAFWGEVKKKLEDRLGLVLHEPSRRNYYSVPSGTSGIHFEWVFGGRPRSWFHVSLHFERGVKEENLRYLKGLEPYLPELEKRLGGKVEVTENWGQRWCSVVTGIDSGEMSEEVKQYAVNKMEIMYKYVKPILDKLRNQFES